jgi:hypothetical protein
VREPIELNFHGTSTLAHLQRKSGSSPNVLGRPSAQRRLSGFEYSDRYAVWSDPRFKLLASQYGAILRFAEEIGAKKSVSKEIGVRGCQSCFSGGRKQL